MGNFQTSFNFALLLALVRQAAYEATWPSLTFPDWRDHFQLVGCIQCLKEVQYILRTWIEELMKEENHFSHLWLLHFSMQLLPWHTLTEDDISLYHFNTTSICSIMHNNEKNFDLERKKVLIQWWLGQADHTEVPAHDGVLIRFVLQIKDIHWLQHSMQSEKQNSLMLTLGYWQNSLDHCYIKKSNLLAWYQF